MRRCWALVFHTQRHGAPSMECRQWFRSYSCRPIVSHTTRQAISICVRLEKKTADGVNAAMIEALRGQTVHSITPDRGKEFARHAVVAEALGIKIYIPPPYQPWQRGTNENTNGLLREYFPKHQDIAQYPDDYLEKAVLALNNRPRKCLQWRTPYEVHFDKALHWKTVFFTKNINQVSN